MFFDLLFPLRKKKYERGIAVLTVQICVFSFQQCHVLNILFTSLSESCLFMALTQAAFVIVELEMLSHLGMVSTVSVKSQRGNSKLTAKNTFPREIWCWPRNNTEKPKHHCNMQYSFNQRRVIYWYLCIFIHCCVSCCRGCVISSKI